MNHNELQLLNDLYVREIADPKFEFGILDYYDPFEALISKVRFLMSVEQGEVLGNPEFGINYDKVLFGGTTKIEELKHDIYIQISYYIPEILEHKLSIEHQMGSDGYKDYLILNININGSNIMDVVI